MNHRYRSTNLCIVLCMLLSATATADVFYDSYQRGLVAFKAKDYVNARSEFLRAYDLRPEPIILFNVAQTYRLQGNIAQALVYYKRFLGESKIAEDVREEAQTYVTELEAEQRAQEAKNRLAESAGPKEPDGTPVKVMTPPMNQPSSQASSPPGDTASDATTDGHVTTWTTRRKVALATATSGVLALAVGAGLGALAKTKQSDAYALCPNPKLACDAPQVANNLIRSGHNLAIGADVAFGVGAAAVIAAGVLWFTGAPSSHAHVTVVPAASSGQVTFTLLRSF